VSTNRATNNSQANITNKRRRTNAQQRSDHSDIDEPSIKREISASKNSLFFAAIQAKNIELVESSLQDGVDVNVKDVSGHSAIFIACKLGAFEVAEVLLRQGAIVDATTFKRIMSEASADAIAFLMKALSSSDIFTFPNLRIRNVSPYLFHDHNFVRIHWEIPELVHLLLPPAEGCRISPRY
jgi:ankyrin repeat protein